jgi:hypothetical protein
LHLLFLRWSLLAALRIAVSILVQVGSNVRSCPEMQCSLLLCIPYPRGETVHLEYRGGNPKMHLTLQLSTRNSHAFGHVYSRTAANIYRHHRPLRNLCMGWANLPRTSALCGVTPEVIVQAGQWRDS